jgi:hypothetical protein
MDHYNRTPETISTGMPSPSSILRGITALIGIITMITGFVFATKIFMLILNVLKEPEAATPFMDMWATALGGQRLMMNLNGITHDFAPTTAIMVIGFGIVILSRLSIALISTGAKTVAWTLGDREAIKKILTHSLGPSRKTRPQSTEPKEDH